MTADAFRAYRIFDDGGTIAGRLVNATLDELTPGEVVLATAYSSVNYKDALAATGVGKILRQTPLIGGIDVAGTVVSSSDKRYRESDRVLVTGYDLGVSNDGGFSEYVRVPADWIVRVPDGLTLFDAMAVGTAGFTAALSLLLMEHNGLAPDNGPVVVSGATGGVGSIAVTILAARGYDVTAVTGKDEEHDYLRSLGASSVLSHHTLDMGVRPLEKETWAGAVDPVGGNVLAWLTRTMKSRGVIASSGLTAGVELNTTVMPFILRGVKLLGVDSAMCPMDERRRVWERLATDIKPLHLPRITREIALEDLDATFDSLLKGRARGRTVVKIQPH